MPEIILLKFIINKAWNITDRYKTVYVFIRLTNRISMPM